MLSFNYSAVFFQRPQTISWRRIHKKHTRIFTKYFLCMFLSQALQRKLPATWWSRETGNVFLPSPGGNSARAEDRAIFHHCPAEQCGSVAGSAGANHSIEGRGDPCCPFSGLDLHSQFPRDHFIFHVGPDFFLSLCFLCLLKQRPTAEGERRSYSAEGNWDQPAPKLSTVQFSRSVMSDSLWLHGLQHARLLCPSPTPGVCSNLCPLSRWCHPTISSSVVPFSSCLQSFPA